MSAMPGHWSEWLLCAGLLLTGLVHLVPAVGLVGAERLQTLYGVTANDRAVLLLLRHRALLFALFGGAMVASVFVPALRTAAAGAGLASMLGFVALAAGVEGAAIRQVVRVDVVLSACLGIALAARTLLR